MVQIPGCAQPKGRYPKEKFNAFLRCARHYVEATRGDRLIQRDVAAIINGLGEQLCLERNRVPGQVLYAAADPGLLTGNLRLRTLRHSGQLRLRPSALRVPVTRPVYAALPRNPVRNAG